MRHGLLGGRPVGDGVHQVRVEIDDVVGGRRVADALQVVRVMRDAKKIRKPGPAGWIWPLIDTSTLPSLIRSISSQGC